MNIPYPNSRIRTKAPHLQFFHDKQNNDPIFAEAPQQGVQQSRGKRGNAHVCAQKAQKTNLLPHTTVEEPLLQQIY